MHAATNTSGNLSYTVDWGEESLMARMLSNDTMTQTEATFTHTYTVAGAYNPTFTVTDADGHKASVSASVVVEAADDTE